MVRFAWFAPLLAALALGACSGLQSGAVPAAGAAPAGERAPLASPGALKVSPAKLNFTTSKELKILVSEVNYTGRFELSVSPRIVKLSAHKIVGPKARIHVTAATAGIGSITITDDHGGRKRVPVTVTQGVIIIQ
jgi:hypothetical protein